jgi:valyl-tRNA synthetase
VWYCSCGEVICSREDPVACPACSSEQLMQDPDVLDTWFSSALWPFSTLGWPDATSDLERFYPTTVLVTGRDIIFFWVARMIFSGLEFMKQVPFRDVMIHGLALDGQGRKMSKSLGNGIDPIEIIEQFGADTLRFSLVTGTTPGNDVRFSLEKVESIRNFSNKIWNASRFVLMNLPGYEKMEPTEDDLELADKWILSRLGKSITSVTGQLERYEVGEAAQTLYDFIWDEFCDWYLELVKPRLYRSRDPRDKQVVQNLLVRVLTDIMKLLHPFMPFISEEVYQHLPGAGPSIMVSLWPEREVQSWPEAEAEMAVVIPVIRAVRNIRNEFNVPPGQRIEAYAHTSDPAKAAILNNNAGYIENMANLAGFSVRPDTESQGVQVVSAHLVDIEILVPVAGVIDVAKEKSRLQKELQKAEQEIARIDAKLKNPGFTSKAPVDVVEKEKGRWDDVNVQREGILRRLSMLEI